jgi:Fe-S oxidoreductase
LADLIRKGVYKPDSKKFAGNKVTYHDPCYLGRANNEYDDPRFLLKELGVELLEMPRNKSFAFCCGAGGGQMFKEAEKGEKEVFLERSDEALKTGSQTIATACPFCMVMMTDGLKYLNSEHIKNFDIAELIAESLES